MLFEKRIGEKGTFKFFIKAPFLLARVYNTYSLIDSMSFPHVFSGTGSRKAFIESECRIKLPINLSSVAQCENLGSGFYSGSPIKAFGDDNPDLT